MYSIEEYGEMIADPVRMGAYAKALQAAIRPGSTVLDLGAGTGIFSLLACQYGARKVYAIETGDAIAIAQRIAEANGFADRIVFLQERSTEVRLPEKADVIVSDMHGNLPLYKANIVSIADARRRMLAAGGVLIPQRESLWAAVVQAPELYEPLVSPWEGKTFGLDMDAAREAVTNMPTNGIVARNQLLGEPQCWGMLDYSTIDSPDHSAAVAFQIARPGTAHGLTLWFDSFLADGVAFSNAPGAPETIYQSLFLPFSAATRLDVEDVVSVRLRADFSGTDYLWSWESKISSGDSERPKAHFRQSMFFGSPLSPKRLFRRSSGFRPALGSQGKVDAWILGAMDSVASLEEIARAATDRFPACFSSPAEALTRVRDLSDTYSNDGEC